MSNQKVDIKVVLLGKEYGGKTSLVERFLHHTFNAASPYQNTIGAAFGAKAISVDGKSVTLGVWDTAGSERYEAMSRIYYRGAKAGIVCYDLTDASSWDRARFWVQEIKTHEENCRVYLCGTKKDLLDSGTGKRARDLHDVSDYADSIDARVFETSSKSGENINEVFEQIARDYIGVPADEGEEDLQVVNLADAASPSESIQQRLTALCC